MYSRHLVLEQVKFKIYQQNQKFATSKMGKFKYYAVKIGHKPGIYNSWKEAEKQVKGFSNAIFKSFGSLKQANSFIGKDSLVKDSNLSSAPYSTSKSNISKSLDLTEFSKKKSSYSEDTLIIYTDGSCINNGGINGFAGIGVFFGVDDPRNVSEPISGLQTNQRAELLAIKKALEISPKNVPIVIRTDSQYAINCLTVWGEKWEKNNYNQNTVMNKEVVMSIRKLLRKYNKVSFEYVKGHSTDVGNQFADELAVQASRTAKLGKTNPKEIIEKITSKDTPEAISSNIAISENSEAKKDQQQV